MAMARRQRGATAALFCVVLLLTAAPVAACFGARLRVGVPSGDAGAVAAFAAGYFIEEKTGVAPEFVDLETTPHQAFADHAVDVLLVAGDVQAPPGAELRPAGVIPGVGPARFWVHPEVLDDLRFFTVDRALGRAETLFTSAAFAAAVSSNHPPRKAARQAVLLAE